MNNSEALVVSKNWLNDIVIEHNFCPFAKGPATQGRVRFVEVESKKQAKILELLIDECCFLDENKDTDTSLLLLTNACGDFYQYLDLLDIANEVMADAGYEGVYQLASFHPDYCFDGCDVDDVANYTNRAPYPMFHLIRESMLEDVLKNVAEPELIPERNIEKCESLGLNYFKAYFHGLKK